MFEKIMLDDGTVRVTGLGAYSLRDTLECGQCFRHVDLSEGGDGGDSFITVIGKNLIRVSQPERGTLVFHGIGEENFEKIARPYFALDRSLSEVKADILAGTDSVFLKEAAEIGEGIAILGQDPWETLVSFIISQNNNIPRIKKIIRRISAEYGVNLSLHIPEAASTAKPNENEAKSKTQVAPCQVSEGKSEKDERCEGCALCPLKGYSPVPVADCSDCGICYTFPTAEDILASPEGLLPSKCGFRYGYILAAAEAVSRGEVDLTALREGGSFEEVMAELKKIKGVGDKVAACVALFGLTRLEAFPIDVWMRRAIDTYFDGVLDPTSLGRYAGIAQQYIFNYIRNIGGNA